MFFIVQINGKNITTHFVYLIILFLMFIKEAYERRIQQELNDHSPTYLKIKAKSPAIGSTKAGRVEFDSKEAFFVQSDIPLKSKTLKIQTQQFKDPDILGLKKKKWNISVQSPKNFDKVEDSHQDTLFKIKHGFMDYTKPIEQRAKKIYPGVDTRNSYQGWNVSTEIGRSQKNENLHNITLCSLDNSISFNQSMLKNYTKPVERFKLQRSVEKQQSLNQSGLFQSFKQEFSASYPNSSPQKINACAFKLLEQTRRQKLKQSMFVNYDEFELSRKFKANLSDSQKIHIEHKYVHNGIWSKVPWAQKGYAWSCCMNQDSNGRGCVKKIIDHNKSNFSSYNNS